MVSSAREANPRFRSWRTGGRLAVAASLGFKDEARLWHRRILAFWKEGYRTAAEAYDAVKLATARRFHPATATVAADRAVFEWKVDDSLPFTRNRAETPPNRIEYRWATIINTTDRAYRIGVTGAPRTPGAPTTDGTLSALLPATARRTLSIGKPLPNGEQWVLPFSRGVAVQTEIAPGVLRLIIRDKAILDDLRRARSTEAMFRFEPCIRPVGSTGSLQCADAKVPITYP